MATVAEALALGWNHHQAGNLRQAEHVYRQILQANPAHFQASYLLAAALQGQGRLADAIAAYRQALRLRPDHAEAHNNLGVALAASGRPDEAAACYREALSLKPYYAEAHNNLGVTFGDQGRLADALACYQQAVRCKPDYAEAHNNLGVALSATGRPAEAAASFQQALRLRPNYAEAHAGLGGALARQGRLDEAAASLRQAVALRPDHADAHFSLGQALAAQAKLGEAATSYGHAYRLRPEHPELRQRYSMVLARLASALSAQGQRQQAIACYRQALQVRPDFPEVHVNLGVEIGATGKTEEAVTHYREALRLRPKFAEALINLGSALTTLVRLDEAVTTLREAVALKPDSGEGHNNLGTALTAQGKLDEAVFHYREALRLKRDDAEVHYNLGTTYVKQEKQAEALACFDEAIRLRPDYAEPHHNRAVVWLCQGDFARGWQEYDWRWKCKEFPRRTFPRPMWDGSPLAGRTILLLGEQGLGDVMQFVRYAALVKQRGGNVVLEVPPALLRILRRCPAIDRLVGQGEPLPDYDVYAPLMSLPRIFGTTIETIPAEVPYLLADEGLVEHWGRELGPHDAFRIGICWQGNPKYQFDAYRSFPLRHFAPMARLPGVRLYSLQKGAGSQQLRELADPFPVVDLAPRLDETTGPFMDTAAVMKNLDLVISCNTAPVHLAGALGVPLWVPLPLASDWRWFLDRDDSPWYPTARLFRQKRLGDWEDVFARITDALRQRLALPERTSPIAVEVAPGELIDKISILEIKTDRISDTVKLANVRHELTVLAGARDRCVPARQGLAELTGELRRVNETLWDIEDAIRLCEREGDFGPRFIELARSVYKNNDRRADLKRRINELLGSRLLEEKSYTAACGLALPMSAKPQAAEEAVS